VVRRGGVEEARVRLASAARACGTDLGPSGPDLGLGMGLVLAASSVGLQRCGKEEVGGMLPMVVRGRGRLAVGLCGVALEAVFVLLSRHFQGWSSGWWHDQLVLRCSLFGSRSTGGLGEIPADADDGDACGRRYLLGGMVEALLILPPSELWGKP
jgi:hypothetical protein